MRRGVLGITATDIQMTIQKNSVHWWKRLHAGNEQNAGSTVHVKRSSRQIAFIINPAALQVVVM